jgi:hypothetical protein
MDPIEVISDEERLTIRQRWSTEGRIEETDFYLKAMIKSGRLTLKLSDVDAKNRAYVEAKKRYPPLSPEVLAEVQERRAADKAGGGLKPKRQAIQADIDIEIPESWGVLPKTSSYRGCVEWVMGESLRAVRHTTNGRIKIDLSHADPAPSEYAVALLKWAAKNENEWQKGTIPKAMNGEEDPGSGNLREAEMRAEEIEAVLRKFDRKAAK